MTCLCYITFCSSVFKGSAVCLYTMNDIRRAFLGPFAHKEGPNYQWIPYQGKVPYPRPGMVRTSTTKIPTTFVNFLVWKYIVKVWVKLWNCEDHSLLCNAVILGLGFESSIQLFCRGLWQPRHGTSALQCPSKTFGSFESTKGFPDVVIQFARHHPLMFNPVYPLKGRPVFLRTNMDYSFTQIAVDRVTAADGQYDVMFIGTGNPSQGT